MRTIVKGKNLDVRDGDRRYVERKMARLERLLDQDTDVIVELSEERHRSAQDSHIVDVTVVMKGQPVRAVAAGATHRNAADVVVDKLERRTVSHKERPRLRSRPEEAKALLRSIADGTADTGEDRGRVVKIKRFAIEPMFPEDAVTRMEELGHAFFVFVDAETERLAVLYRRRDGDYGVIEPVVGGAYTPSAGQRSRAARR